MLFSFLATTEFIALLLSLYIESDTVHYEELLRNPPLLFVNLSLLACVCANERGLGHLHGRVLYLAEE